MRSPYPSPPILRTERLALRLAGLGDIPSIIQHYKRNEDFLKPWSPTLPEELYTSEFWKEFVHRSEEDYKAGTSLLFFIFHCPDTGAGAGRQELIGRASFTQIVRGPFQACYLGYELGEASQGQGFMTEALREAIAFGFGAYHLHRIMANHLPENTRSASVLARLGFTREGLARDYLRIDGRWRDHVLNSLTNEAWQPR